MPKRALAILAAVAVIAIAAAAFFYYQYTHSPRYALKQAAKAAREHDLATFKKYVDTEKLTERMVDDILAIAAEEAKGEEDFGTALATGMLAMMKPMLVKATRDSLEQGIETGELDSGDASKGNPAKAAKEYWSEAKEGQSGYRGIKSVREEGKIAIAALEIYDADLRLPLTLDLKLRDLGSHWQVTEISNLRAVQKQIADATKKRIEELNAPIRAELDRAVRFESISGSATAGLWGLGGEAAVSVALENTSGRAIDEVQFVVSFVSGGQPIGEIECAETALAPNAKKSGTWKKNVNQFVERDMKLFRGIKDAQPQPRVRRVRYADGKVLELKTTL